MPEVYTECYVTVGSNTISVIEEFSYREIPDDNVKPILVMNSITPVGYRQGHKYYEIHLVAKSEAESVLGAYFKENGSAHQQINTLTVKMKCLSGAEKTYTFSTVYPVGKYLSLRHEEEGLTDYKFYASTVSVT